MLDETKGFCFDGQQKLGLEDGPCGVAGDIESRDARVGSWEVVVVWWSDSDAGHRLESLFTSREGGT